MSLFITRDIGGPVLERTGKVWVVVSGLELEKVRQGFTRLTDKIHRRLIKEGRVASNDCGNKDKVQCQYSFIMYRVNNRYSLGYFLVLNNLRTLLTNFRNTFGFEATFVTSCMGLCSCV